MSFRCNNATLHVRFFNHAHAMLAIAYARNADLTLQRAIINCFDIRRYFRIEVTQ